MSHDPRDQSGAIGDSVNLTFEAESWNRMLRLILDSIPLAVFWKDRQSRYLGCNQVVARAFGLASPEEILGLDDYQLLGLTHDQATNFVAHDRSVMTSAQPEVGIIEQATMANGTTIWMETNKFPIYDNQGAVVGVLGTWCLGSTVIGKLAAELAALEKASSQEDRRIVRRRFIAYEQNREMGVSGSKLVKPLTFPDFGLR